MKLQSLIQSANGAIWSKRLVCAIGGALPYNGIAAARTPLNAQCQGRSYASRPVRRADPDAVTEDPINVIGPDLDSDLQSVPAPVNKPKRGRKPRASKTTTSDNEGTLSRITPGSQYHYDLTSFLNYASITSLSTTSKTYLGTHFEYTVLAALSRLGFNLTRVGGVSDLGIDLRGHWTIPEIPRPLPAIIQCKATNPLAVMMRELEGAVMSAPPGWKGDNTIALLAASKVATKGIRDAIARSNVPMGFLCISADQGLVKQFVWNQAAVQKCGLVGVGVSLKHPEGSVVLTWDGKPWSLPPKNSDGCATSLSSGRKPTDTSDHQETVTQGTGP